MDNIKMGTLYDMNKIAVSKEKPLSNKEFAQKLYDIKQFCISCPDQYFMLLNRENYDFTLFNLGKTIHKINKIIYDDLKECLQNRGKVISIDLTENKDAYEIWIKINNEVFVYYFFPYDQGVIQ